MKKENKQNSELIPELERMLRKLLVKSETDEKLRDFLDDLYEMLKKDNKQVGIDFKTALASIQEKHFPNFEEGESKK
ncbi:hypothetical protein C1N66_13650 [Bacillus cereus]|uniref:Group-specific protein n=1 Tax=Bacillus cereus TaxID=1396 RepID=A0AB73UIU9_BACCE|nr:hypothetical protein [Bacillus cereus]QHV06941.1 hypothetical protein C1N82_28425 [Bacillus cereus]QHV44112.1 hypothetical protein C1N66_13650 [Bacillus cereus]